jgi:hypothetical protein
VRASGGLLPPREKKGAIGGDVSGKVFAAGPSVLCAGWRRHDNGGGPGLLRSARDQCWSDSRELRPAGTFSCGTMQASTSGGRDDIKGSDEDEEVAPRPLTPSPPPTSSPPRPSQGRRRPRPPASALPRNPWERAPPSPNLPFSLLRLFSDIEMRDGVCACAE